MRASDRTAAHFVFAAAALAASAIACQVLVNFEVEPPAADGGTSDAAPDAPEPDGPVDPCGAIPARRSPPQRDDRAVPGILFAAYRWGFIPPADAGDLCEQAGMNLDGIDTQPPSCDDMASCKQYPGPKTISNCDYAGGIDNMSLAFSKNQSFNPGGFLLNPDELDTALSRGAINILAYLTEWNGEDDDDDITLTFYSSAGMEGGPTGPKGYDQLKALEPIWDGGQDAAWIVDERSLDTTIGLDQPRYDAKGYVRRGMLVVDKVDLGFGLPGFDIIGVDGLRNGRFAGRLVRDGNRMKITHGRLAATATSRSILAITGGIRKGDLSLLCEGKNIDEYTLARGLACRLLDMPADPTKPNRDVACEHVSVGFTMASVESHFAYEDAGGDKAPLARAKGYAQARPPCPDYDAGTVWCDDCAWEKPDRCDASLPLALDGGAD